MPAESKSQQRTMGMVYAYKKGELDLKDLTPSLAKKIKEIADGTKRKTGDKRKKTKGISLKDAKAFASTKHKGLPEKVHEGHSISLNQETRNNYIDFIMESSMDDRKDLERMSDEELERRYYEICYFLEPHPSGERTEIYPDENERIITKFDKFVNEASKPLPVAHKINGKWELESFPGLKEATEGWNKFEILGAKRDPGYGYDHVVMLFIRFLEGIPKKYQTPENTYGLCIYDMDKHDFIEEPSSLEDYNITLDNLEQKTGFSIPVNEGIVNYDLEQLEAAVPEWKIIEAFKKHGLSADEKDNFENEIKYVDAEEISVCFTSYAFGGELPKNISEVMDDICDTLGANYWTFWDPMEKVRFFFND